MEQFGDVTLLEAVNRAKEGFGGAVAWYAKRLDSGVEAGERADTVMPTASVIKVGIMAELYRQVEAGLVDLSDRIAVQASDWYGGTGVLKEMMPGVEPALLDLCRLMIIVSDNVATGMLVRLLDKERINQSFVEWGLPCTELRMRMALGGDIREYAVSTPRELGRLYELIATDGFLSPASCAAMRDHLGRQQHLEQIPRDLPYNPYARDLGIEEPVRVFNKIGNYMGMRVDAALIEAPASRFILVTMNEGSADHGFSIDQEGNRVNGRIGRAVFDHWARATA